MQQATTLTVRGLTMRGMEHVPEEGTGPYPAAILLHGFTANKLQEHRMFWKLSKALEESGIASFRYDFLGSGESDGDFVDMTVSREVEETKAILAAVREDPRIHRDRITLIGLSMGGMVAGIVAGDCAADIHQLVLICPAGTIYDSMMAGPLGDMVRAGVWIDEAADAWGNLFGKAFLDDLAELDGFARAKAFTGNVLLVHGTEDKSVPFAVSERYQAESFGGRAQLHPIQGADHTFNKSVWEREMIEAVVTFIREQEGPLG